MNKRTILSWLVASALLLNGSAAFARYQTCHDIDQPYSLVPISGAVRARFEDANLKITKFCVRHTIPEGKNVELVFRLREGEPSKVVGEMDHLIHAVVVDAAHELSDVEMIFFQNQGNEKIDSILYSAKDMTFSPEEYGYDGSSPEVMHVSWDQLSINLADAAESRTNYQTSIQTLVSYLSSPAMMKESSSK